MEDGNVYTRLAALVRDVGYKALVEENAIKTKISGYSALIFLQEPSYLQFYFGVTKDENIPFSLEDANSFSRRTRFGKCYVAEDYIGFESDFFCDIDGDRAEEDIARAFDIFETIISRAEKALDECEAKGSAA